MHPTIAGTGRRAKEGFHRELRKSADRIREETSHLLQRAKSARAAAFQKTREDVAGTLTALRRRVAEVSAEARDFLGTCQETGNLRTQQRAAQHADREAGGRERTSLRRGTSASPPHVARTGEAERRQNADKAARDERPSGHGPKDPLSDAQKVLAIIRQHPQGITATAVGERLSMTGFAVGRIASQLAALGKMHKDTRTRKYYPKQ